MINERDIAGGLSRDAIHAVTTQRGQQHGDLEPSFKMIAELWSTFINHTMANATGINPHITLSAVDALQMMALVKKARTVYGDTEQPDHFVDDIGYTSLAGGLQLRDSVNRKAQEEIGKAMVQAQGEAAVAQELQTNDADHGIQIPAFLKEKKL